VNDAVLVTGAVGFVGAHLVRALAADRAVRAIDVRPAPASVLPAGVRFAAADVRDPSSFEPLLAGVDTVFHLASAHLQVNQSEAEYRAVNVQAAAALVHACAAAGVRRFVHTSTVGIYGHVVAPPADESTAPAPGNAYERTKLEGEDAVRAAAAPAGIELIVVRPAWVYGPGCPRMAKLLRSIQRKSFVYVGSGSNLRHPIYISDAVDALLRAGAADAGCAGRSYIVAGPRPVTLRQLVEACARQLGVAAPTRRLPRPLAVAAAGAAELAFRVARREPPFSRRSLLFFENDNAFDTTAARQDLGFEPRIELDEGLRRTIDEGSWTR
jgi:dihydroflavonol-4-reductase